MTRSIGTVCLSLLAFLLVPLLPAQDNGAASPGRIGPPKPPSAEEQIRWTKPGKEHQALARYVGKWDVTVRMGLGKQAIGYNGTATTLMRVGGRFLEIEYAAQNDKEQTEGTFSIGFDHRHQEYVLVAMDSFGTYFVTSQGPRDEKTGKIRMAGKDDDPTMKAMGHTKEFLHVLDEKSDDEFVIEVWFVDTRNAGRREFKFMDYTFRRAK